MSTYEKLVDYKIANMCKKTLDSMCKLEITPNTLYEFICQIIESRKKKKLEKTTSPQFKNLQLTHVLRHSKRLHVDTPNENSSCVKHIESNQSKCEIEIPSQRLLGKPHLLANTFPSTNI
jgi:hypothetical protein